MPIWQICGRVITPINATGPVEGGPAQVPAVALTDGLLFDQDGKPLSPQMITYRIRRAKAMPATDVILVRTGEPSGPPDTPSAAEITIGGAPPHH